VGALPSVFFELNGGERDGGATVEVKPTAYMDNSSGNTWRMRLYTSESSGAVLGANTMRDHDVVFDEENGRIGWVEADCHTPDVIIPTPMPTPVRSPASSPAPSPAKPSYIQQIKPASIEPTSSLNERAVAEVRSAVQAVKPSGSPDNSAIGGVHWDKLPVSIVNILAAIGVLSLFGAAVTIGYVVGQRSRRSTSDSSVGVVVHEEYGEFEDGSSSSKQAINGRNDQYSGVSSLEIAHSSILHKL